MCDSTYLERCYFQKSDGSLQLGVSIGQFGSDFHYLGNQTGPKYMHNQSNRTEPMQKLNSVWLRILVWAEGPLMLVYYFCFIVWAKGPSQLEPLLFVVILRIVLPCFSALLISNFFFFFSSPLPCLLPGTYSTLDQITFLRKN